MCVCGSLYECACDRAKTSTDGFRILELGFRV